MAAVANGEFSTSLGGTVLTFTDTGTGYGTIISRTLNLYDYNGNLLTIISMGTSLSATYTISADQYITGVLSVTDNAGTYTVTKNYLAQGIYAATYLAIIKLVGCSCNCSAETYAELTQGELFLAAANRYALGGFAVAAQNNITAANLSLAA